MESQEFKEDQEPILLTAANEPFRTEQAAASTIGTKKLVGYEVIPWDGGFGIRKKANVQPEYVPPNKPDKPEYVPPDKRFYIVKFSAKSSPNDTDDVILSVNGETLIAQRAREVIIPARFRECADHATYPQTRQLPGQNRKIVAQIKTYPYELIGEATEKDYLSGKEKGTQQTKRNILKYGYDVSPDDLI